MIQNQGDALGEKILEGRFSETITSKSDDFAVLILIDICSTKCLKV